MVACGLSPVARRAGHAHRLIGEASSACRHARCRRWLRCFSAATKPNERVAAAPDRPDQLAEIVSLDPIPAVARPGSKIVAFGHRLVVHALRLARCSTRGEPPCEIGNELFGVGAAGNGAAIGAERAHRLDIGRRPRPARARLADNRRRRRAGKTQAPRSRSAPSPRPIPRRDRVRPSRRCRRTGDDRDNGRTPARGWRPWRGTCAVPHLSRCSKAADAAEIAADAAGEMRELNFQRRQLIEQAAN